jgi:hypothetical protein
MMEQQTLSQPSGPTKPAEVLDGHVAVQGVFALDGRQIEI